MSSIYRLHGHPLSYFSRKLEAALVFYGIPFEAVEVALGKGGMTEVRKRAGTHQLPVLETPEGWAIADTTPIMFMLDARFPKRRLFPEGPTGVLVHMIENFLDEWLGRTMVHYRWHYEECAGPAALEMASGNGEAAVEIARWGLKACRATGVSTPHQQAMVEEEYARILEAAEEQLAVSRYLMGDRPTAVDAVMIGGLRGHTLADPVPARLVEQFPRVLKWVEEEADNWDGEGLVAPIEAPTGFARLMIAEMSRSFVPFIKGLREALRKGEKAFIARVYDEDVSYLTRPYPAKACDMVVEHARNVLSEEELKDMAGRARVWGVEGIYPFIEAPATPENVIPLNEHARR